jgi:hypothetical protein
MFFNSSSSAGSPYIMNLTYFADSLRSHRRGDRGDPLPYPFTREEPATQRAPGGEKSGLWGKQGRVEPLWYLPGEKIPADTRKGELIFLVLKMKACTLCAHPIKRGLADNS